MPVHVHTYNIKRFIPNVVQCSIGPKAHTLALDILWCNMRRSALNVPRLACVRSTVCSSQPSFVFFQKKRSNFSFSLSLPLSCLQSSDGSNYRVHTPPAVFISPWGLCFRKSIFADRFFSSESISYFRHVLVILRSTTPLHTTPHHALLFNDVLCSGWKNGSQTMGYCKTSDMATIPYCC